MRRFVPWILAFLCAVALAQTASKPTAAKSAAKPAAEDHKAWAPAELQWGPAPDIMPAGAQLAVLEGNPTKPGEFTMRLKMPNGYKIPPHFHPRMEHVTLLSGSFHVGMGDKFDEAKMVGVPVGTFIWIKPGSHHFAMARGNPDPLGILTPKERAVAKATGETVIQLHGNGPWLLTYVNPQDDPRKKR